MATPSPSTPKTTEVLKKVDDQLTCAICIEHYTDPRALPCQHIYCKKCIDKMLLAEEQRHHNEFDCPTCRKSCILSGGGASTLPCAYYINSLLDIHSLLMKTANASHQECSLHKKPKDILCETCDELICYRCIYAEKHDNHRDKTILVDELLEKHKREVCKHLQPLKDKIEQVRQLRIVFDDTKKSIEKQGEMVKKEIGVAVQKHMTRLAELMKSLEDLRTSLLELADNGTRQKLYLHSREMERLDTVFAQLTSCEEFVEKSLVSHNQWLSQNAKSRMIRHIDETYSVVKASELQPPSQRADGAFIQNLSSLSMYTLPDVGSLKGTVNFQSVPDGCFSVADLPQCVAGKITKVCLTASLPSLTAKLLHCSLNLDDKVSSNCSVTQVDEVHFNVMLAPKEPGLHILSVRVGEHEGNRHSNLFEVPVISIAEWRESRLEVFTDGLRHPHGVAVTDDGKYVIVTEKQGNCVTVFSADGAMVNRLGKHGSRPGELENPREVAVSADGQNIFVMDNNQIQKFTTMGVHKASLSRSARHIGNGMVSHSGSILTCSTSEKMEIHRLSHAFSRLESFSRIPSGKPIDIAVDTKGLIYVLTPSNGIHKFTPWPEGKHISSFGSKGTQPHDHQFKSPCELCIDTGNTIYVTDGSKVKMFTTDGDFLGTFGSHPKLRGITVSNNGDLYVCKASGEVLVSLNTIM